MFLCSGDSCECQTLHSNCPRQRLKTITFTTICASIINFLVLCPLVTKFYLLPYMLCSCGFVQCRCDVDFRGILVFIILYMYKAPANSPRGQSFDVNKNVSSLHSFVASFLKISSKSDFIQLFNIFNTCLLPQERGRQPPPLPKGKKFWCQQKRLVTLFICYKLQNSAFEVWFYIMFFMI